MIKMLGYLTQLPGVLANTVGSIVSGLKYVPYKAGEPKRFVPLLIGVGVLIAVKQMNADTKKAKFGKGFLAAFGPVLIGASLAGIINPVTVYSGQHYATEGNTGYTYGQSNPEFGRTAPGSYYDAPVPVPGQKFFNMTPPQPAPSPRAPNLPAIGTVGSQLYATEGNTGYTMGQSNPEYGRTAPGTYYATEISQPTMPLLYSNNVVGCNPITGQGCGVEPTNGDVYIRDFGEVDFQGGN